jgi:hypothetical protein
MTPEEITKRNRANARHSTGPRTLAGKAIVAMNARRHGATAKPDRERVITWLRIILNSPMLQPDDLLERDERIDRATVLAEAEARHAAAERALQAFEADTVNADEQMQHIRAQVDMMTRFLQRAETAARTDSAGVKVISRIDPSVEDDLKLGGRRHLLLRRYLAEARSRRNKAFAAWLDWVAAPDHGPGSEPANTKSRNKASTGKFKNSANPKTKPMEVGWQNTTVPGTKPVPDGQKRQQIPKQSQRLL